MGGAHGQVVRRRHAGNVADAADFAVVAHGEIERVAPIEQAEGALQQVITVGATTDDVQEKIELGGRRTAVEPAGRGARRAQVQGVVHWSMTSRRRVSPREMSSRRGMAAGESSR